MKFAANNIVGICRPGSDQIFHRKHQSGTIRSTVSTKIFKFFTLIILAVVLFDGAAGQCISPSKTTAVSKGSGGWFNSIGHTLNTTSNRGNTRLGVSVSPARSNGIQNVTINFWDLDPANLELRGLAVDESGARVAIERCLTPQGTRLKISEIGATAYFEGSSYRWIGKAIVTLIDGDTMAQNDRYRVEFIPKEITPKPKPKDQIPVIVSGVLFEGEVKKSEGDIVLDDEGSIELITANVKEGHKLEIGFDTDYIGQRKVDIEMTINGRPVKVSSNYPSGWGQTITIDLKEAGVPRFERNQVFRITAILNLANGVKVFARRSAAILLPVVIVPGIASTDSGNSAGDNEFKFLETDLLSLSSKNIHNYHPDKHLGEGYRMRGDGNYWTLSTLEYPRNKSTMAEGAEYLSRHIEKVLEQTYASKVYLIAHSYGGLVSRYYIQNGNGGRHVAEFIQAQSPNLGSIHAVYGQQYSDLRGFGYKYQDIFPIWATYLPVGLPSHWFEKEAPETVERRNPELARMNGIAVSENNPPFPDHVPYTILFSRHHATFGWWMLKDGYYIPRVFKGDGMVPAFSQLGLYLPPDVTVNDPAITIPILDSLNGVRVPALKKIRICQVEFEHEHTYGVLSSETWNDFKRNFPSLPFPTPPRPREERLFLEKQDVVEFLWYKRLSEGLLPSASFCPTQ